ncbi:MAG: AAA family ATPase, partial [Phycisphaerales bacterium JB063]
MTDQPNDAHSANTAPDLEDLNKLKTAYDNVREQIGKVIVGQDDVIEQLLVSIFAKGHCILEGVPGLA